MKYNYEELKYKIENHDYDAVYPTKPVIPSILKDLDNKIRNGEKIDKSVVKASTHYQSELIKYEDAIIKYNSQKNKLNSLLKEDIIDTCFSQDFLDKWSNLANMIYSNCYERGHSYGYYEVFNLLYNMAYEIEQAMAKDIKSNKDYDLKD